MLLVVLMHRSTKTRAMTDNCLDEESLTEFLPDLDKIYAQYVAATTRVQSDEREGIENCDEDVLHMLWELKKLLAMMIAEHPRTDVKAMKYRARVVEEYCLDEDGPGEASALSLARIIQRWTANGDGESNRVSNIAPLKVD